MGEDIRLHEGELNIMELLWSNKVLAAKDIAKIIKEYIGWEKNTTYTVIKRLIDKGAIKREDPGFICRAVISKREVQRIETKEFLNEFYNESCHEETRLVSKHGSVEFLTSIKYIDSYLKKGDKILEVGAGMGILTKILLKF